MYEIIRNSHKLQVYKTINKVHTTYAYERVYMYV